MGFDKSILMSNIAYMLKKRGIKIGDLESAIGVSKGYISRINKKNDGVAAGIDIVSKIAKQLEISIDVLVNVNLKAINDNEVYILNLLNAFNTKTESKEIFWERIDVRTINEIISGKGYSNNMPMMEVHPDDRDERIDLPRHICVSYFLDMNLSTGNEQLGSGPWFYYKINKDTTVYICDMIYHTYEGEPREVLEMYIQKSEYIRYEDEYGGSGFTSYENYPLCCSETMGSNIGCAMTTLYRTITSHQNDIRLTGEIKSILDDFLKE